ncbi:MAG: hypothetical protein JWQ35_1467 [Bacteriovoracaceae bacterium]|nr:hypothetical protein [Bacteriovoracaceae bacterium]
MTKTEAAQTKSVSDSTRKFSPNWLPIFYFGFVHTLGLLAWPTYLLLGGGIHWQEFAIFFFMFFMGIIGINVGYHRACSHLSFKMSSLMRFLVLFGGASVAEGTLLVWCSDHRRHHKFQDTEKDPYNINRGFWWAHMGWMIGSPSTTDFSNCPDLVRDPWIRHQNKYYGLWLVVSCFLLPLGLGFLLGRPIAGFLLGGLMRLFLFNQFTFLINSYAHYFGRRPYSTELTARDSLICAIFAHGEGWHNFHHKFPFDFRNGHRFFHYDPAKWIIYFGQFVGLTSRLKTTPVQEIYRARIQTHRQKVVTECAHVKTMSEALDAALEQWTSLGLEWTRLKAEFGRKSAQMKILSQQSKTARQEFKVAYATWKQSLKAAQAAPFRAG